MPWIVFNIGPSRRQLKKLIKLFEAIKESLEGIRRALEYPEVSEPDQVTIVSVDEQEDKKPYDEEMPQDSKMP